jgi:hypothetical protein
MSSVRRALGYLRTGLWFRRAASWLTGLLVAFAVAFLLVSGAAARSERSRPTLGVLGSADRFQQLTGQRSTVRHVILSWSQGNAIPKLIAELQPVPMLGINTGGTITPLGIAQGRGDAFLAALNAALADYGGLVYVRPLAEMNGHWNEYSAFNRDGSSRGTQNSTAAFRKAFARIAVLARGGTTAGLNARLRRLGLPLVQGSFPPTRARIVWNPQGYGSPDIPANSAQAYYPGDPFVDVVANDLYDQNFNAAWDANERLYAAHPNKAYGIAEWGLWGIDDVAFVERMATFVRTHPRTEFLAYYSGRPGSEFDLASKPRSRAAYRKLITPLGR